jgi:hypothetical protein
MSTDCPACIAAEKSRRAAIVADRVHEVRPGLWIVAEQNGGRWEAPVDPRAGLGAVHTVFAGSLESLARDGAVRTYRHRSSAVRACGAREDAESAMCRPCERRVEAEMAAYDAERARRECEMYGY